MLTGVEMILGNLGVEKLGKLTSIGTGNILSSIERNYYGYEIYLLA